MRYWYLDEIDKKIRMILLPVDVKILSGLFHARFAGML